MREYMERYKSFDIIYRPEIDDYKVRGPYDGREKVDPPSFPTFKEAVEWIDEFGEIVSELLGLKNEIASALLDSEKGEAYE